MNVNFTLHGAIQLEGSHSSFSFQSLTSCAVISEEVMVNHFLPGLRCLRADMEQLSPEHEVRRHTDMHSHSGSGGGGVMGRFHSYIQTPAAYSILSACWCTDGAV